MKYFFLKLLIILPFLCPAQRHLVEYELTPASIRITEKTKDIEGINYHNQLKMTIFLELDNTGYIFEVDKKEFENIDRQKKYRKELALIHSIYRRIYYNKRDNIMCLRKHKEEAYNVQPPTVYQWTLTNETAEISGYKVYKAFVDVPYINRVNEQRINHVIAWYCPDIPYNYAPLGFHGLPGLVLSLESLRSKYVAKKITFNVSDKPITPPTEYEELKKTM